VNRRTLHRRPSGNLEERSSISVCSLAVSFSDVLRNRLRCTQQLIVGVTVYTPKTFRESVCPRNVFKRKLVDIELFVTEIHGLTNLIDRCAAASPTIKAEATLRIPYPFNTAASGVSDRSISLAKSYTILTRRLDRKWSQRATGDGLRPPLV